MTLTEFLLARIAEDEARIPSGLAQVTIGGVTGYIDPAAERMRLECEAKRRIVEELAEAMEWDASLGEAMTDTAAAGRRALLHLATIYADHPDYLPEWRP